MTINQFTEKNTASVLYTAFRRHLEALEISEKSIRNYKSDFDHFIRWLMVNLEKIEMLDNRILSLDEETITTYKQFLLSSQTPRLTINRRLTSIRHLASYLVEHNYINYDFTKNIKNVGSHKRQTREVAPFNYTNVASNKSSKPAVPVLVTSGAVILLILQIILVERPSTPWSNVIAKQGGSVPTDQIENVAINTNHTTNLEGKQISVRLQPTESKEVFLSAKPVLIDEKQIVLEMTSEIDSKEATSGKGEVKAGTNSTIIYSDSADVESIIQITPTSSTENQIIYIKKQEEGMFVVGFDEIVNQKVTFNWEIVSN